MVSFSLPQFSRLSPRLARAEREFSQMEQYFERHSGEVADGEWGATAAVASGIHNVYNGIEDVLLSIAKDVDDFVPTGPTAHQDVLDQMVSELAGTRPALLDQHLYEALTELKGFRHLVRHRYGFDLRPDKVIENLELLRISLPAFVRAVVRLEQAMR